MFIMILYYNYVGYFDKSWIDNNIKFLKLLFSKFVSINFIKLLYEYEINLIILL